MTGCVEVHELEEHRLLEEKGTRERLLVERRKRRWLPLQPDEEDVQKFSKKEQQPEPTVAS